MHYSALVVYFTEIQYEIIKQKDWNNYSDFKKNNINEKKEQKKESMNIKQQDLFHIPILLQVHWMIFF